MLLLSCAIIAFAPHALHHISLGSWNFIYARLRRAKNKSSSGASRKDV
jgi:hypothetical protein